MAIDRLAVAMNLANHAVTQYQGFNFNSMVEHDGRFFGFNEDGIFELETGDVDAVDALSVDPIDAEVIFAPLNDGRIGRKRIRKFLLDVDMDEWSSMAVNVLGDGQRPRSTAYSSTGSFVMPRNNMTGESLEVSVSNIGGCYFDLKGVDVFFLQLHRDGRR